MTQLRAIWQNINASYWFYPALFSLLAVALAVTTIWLDRNGFASFLNDIESVVPARPDGASNMLTVIAGSMIGVASTVFSITIAAVAYASGNYGPRLLTNFMEDRGNQFSLATFIGTFVFALTVLRSVRAEDESALFFEAGDAAPGFVPQLSLLVAFGLTGISVAVLVYFLNHIPASIRINTVLKGIGERLLRMIATRYPDDYTGPTPHDIPTGGEAVRASDTGYIQIIDYEDLGNLARKRDARFVLRVRTGDFVHTDMLIGRWIAPEGNPDGCGEDTDGGEKSSVPLDAIGDCFAFGGRRTPNQDLNFLVDELSEIALRALSPGINDPFTAVTALHWTGAAIASLGARNVDIIDAWCDADQMPRVYPVDDDFAHFLHRGFGAIRPHAAGSPIAARAFLETLVAAGEAIADPARRGLIKEEAARLLDQSRKALDPRDFADLEEAHARDRRSTMQAADDARD